MSFLPFSALAQECPTVTGHTVWHRVDPSWNTHAQFNSAQKLEQILTNPRFLLSHFRPAARGGRISELSVAGRNGNSHISFRYQNTGVNGVINGDVYNCPISYLLHGSQTRCEGQRLWFNLEGSSGDLQGIVSAFVIDFCTSPVSGGSADSIEVNTISSLLEGPRYNSWQFFTRIGPYAARMMQAQSAEIMKATLRAYEATNNMAVNE